MRLMAVSAFSPPERLPSGSGFLPGSCTKIPTPDSRRFSSSIRRSSARPPWNRRGNTSANFALISTNALENRSRVVRLIRWIAFARSSRDFSRSSFWVVRNEKRSVSS
jgi:hypothetical protein